MNILQMDRDELLEHLYPTNVCESLISAEELLHIADCFGCFWSYDYEAAQKGRKGYHAELKSGLHSDGFFNARELTAIEPIRRFLAMETVKLIRRNNWWLQFDWIAGVPDGATKIAKDIGGILCRGVVEMIKEDGRIFLASFLEPRDRVLLIDDIFTTGKGFSEAAEAIIRFQPRAFVLPLDPVLLNRNPGREFQTSAVWDPISVLALAEKKLDDWSPEVCPLCREGSQAIKPKASPENWQRLITSQK